MATDDVPQPPEPAGDPACWLDRVCPACGQLAEGEPRPGRCPVCGEPLPEA